LRSIFIPVAKRNKSIITLASVQRKPIFFPALLWKFGRYLGIFVMPGTFLKNNREGTSAEESQRFAQKRYWSQNGGIVPDPRVFLLY
jgi:hypothetical protein